MTLSQTQKYESINTSMITGDLRKGINEAKEIFLVW